MGLGAFLILMVFTLNTSCYGQSSSLLPTTVTPDQYNDYCKPKAQAPEQTLFNCSSCKNRCGDIKNFYIQVYCSCDSSCVAYGDCCTDFEQSCPSQFKASSSLRRHFQYRKTDCYPISITDKDLEFIDYFTHYNFVSICGQTGVICNRTNPYDVLEPNYAIPVTDTETGVNYVNYKCAECNNVFNVVPWIPQVLCDSSMVSNDSQNGTFSIDTEEKLMSYLSLCNIIFVVPLNVRVRPFCGGFNNKCSSTCNNTDLVNNCENSYKVDYIRSDSSTYDNPYCALCSGETIASLDCAFLTFTAPDYEGGTEGLFSLSVLFDFNPSEGVTVGRKACSDGQRWIAASRDCRQVECPEDQRLLDGNCIGTSLNLTLTASLFFNHSKDLSAVSVNFESNNLLIKNLNDQLMPLLDKGDKMSISLNQSKTSEYVNITVEVSLIFDKNSSFNFGPDLGNFSESFIDALKNELILLVQRAGVNLANVIIVVDENLSFSQDLLMDCTWFFFSNEEFAHQNDTLVMKSTNKVYTMERYRLVKSGALICISNEEVGRIRLVLNRALGILTIVLISLSIICLTARIILQFKITYFKSFAGKLHFNLCLALLLAFLMLMIGGAVSLTQIKELCTAFGTLTYWFFLASFLCMSTVTFDTWIAFRSSSTFVKASGTNKALIKYVLLCWLFPAIIAIIVTSLDFADIDHRFQPQFGINLCWFNQRYALLVYFGVPVALLTILTTIFFILTVSSLRKNMNSSTKPSSEKQPHEIWIYFRLYVLMGVSWVFGFVAAFVGHDALWIIFIILNASQGILIFISFVLNNKVLKEIKSLKNRLIHPSSNTSTDLSSSNTNPRSP